METFTFSKARKYIPNFYKGNCAICGKKLADHETIYHFRADDYAIEESIACKDCKKVHRNKPIPTVQFI